MFDDEEEKDEQEESDEIDDAAPLDEVEIDEATLEGDEDEDDDAALAEEDDEEEEASLEELLAERSAPKRTGDDVEEEDDIMALVPEPDVAIDEVLPVRVIPVKDQEEFVCARCHLVKKKVQMVDADRRLCRDCA